MDVAVVGSRIEVHEADVWCRMVAATGDVPGDPLRARVDRSGAVPLFALTAINAPLFNRVVSLGVARPAGEAEVDRIVAWFAGHGQTRFWVEVTPASRPEDVREHLASRGLVDTGSRIAKTWCRPSALPATPGIAIEELGPGDRDGFAACNAAAWGVPPVLLPWFGAVVGADGFRHFGIREDGRIVSTGTLCIADGLAWLGYGATLPECRGRGYQSALLAHRITEAWRMGCEIAHSETAEDTDEDPNPSLRNMHRVGMATIHDKEVWAPAS